MTDERWRLYIGNLPYDEITGEDLKRLALPFGSVVGVEVCKDASSGRGKGFGWVDMSRQSEAIAAAEGIRDREFLGRRLTAYFPIPRPPSSEGEYRPVGGY